MSVETLPPPIDTAPTPMMAQYLAIKATQRDALVFYRMGDFYELFFEDALHAAPLLDVALTKRGKHLGSDIPMCGVPVASLDMYLARLVKAGRRVAICEQTEDPAAAKARGSKAVVARAVVRVVTPGTLTEDNLLDTALPSFIAAVATDGHGMGLALLDISTGVFLSRFDPAPQPETLLTWCTAHNVVELLVPEPLAADPLLAALPAGISVSKRPKSQFHPQNGQEDVAKALNVADASVFGAFEPAEYAASGALLNYVRLTQCGKLPALQGLQRLSGTTTLRMDATTLRNLELLKGQDGSRTASLLGVIDLTKTAGGSRLLAEFLASPSCALSVIQERQQVVTAFVQNHLLLETLRSLLAVMPDLARALGRISLDRALPRDLAAMQTGLACARSVQAALIQYAGHDPVLLPLLKELQQPTSLCVLEEALSRALLPELPATAKEGGIFARGFDAALDSLLTLKHDARGALAALQAEYQVLTKIPSLKISYNAILGYYIEATPKYADMLLSFKGDEVFNHRQTMASGTRFTTDRLRALETDIVQAESKALARELVLFEQFINDIKINLQPIQKIIKTISFIDVVSTLAHVAITYQWVQPELVEDPLVFTVENGRHPVVEAVLAKAGGGQPFTPNACDLSAHKHVWLLTGPNMGGKSTYLRQQALIAILAQMGSYVPASRAVLGVVDRIFARVGASDDLSRGRSTFMVEMVETAAILHQATHRSLVVLDEIGRGTATFDGMALAWAVLEHIHSTIRCRALFATHYHELTRLQETLPALHLAQVDCVESQGVVLFTHKVKDGAADKSYGLQVARLAGLPKAVLTRASVVLKEIEKQNKNNKIEQNSNNLPLFDAPLPEPVTHPAVDALAALDVDALSPREALDVLYRLKAL